VIDRQRYARQMLLAEIGEEGQETLARSVARLAGPGLGHEIAEMYAVRAGLGGVVAGELDESALSPAFLRLPAARAVVAGSRAALLAIRHSLQVDVPPRLEQ
jgi:hypothetical protein